MRTAEKINILLVKRVFEQYGGSERVVLNLLSRLPDERFTVNVVLLKNASAGTSELERQITSAGHPYDVLQWKDKTSFITIPRELDDLCKRRRIDLIHSHDPRSNLVAMLLRRRRRIPAVASIHGWVRTPWWVRAFEFLDFLTLFFFDGVITISNSQRDFLLRRGIKPEKVRRIYNVSDHMRRGTESLSKIEAKRRLGLGPDTLVVGSAGRLCREKGLQDLLSAFSILAQEYPSLRLLLVGEGYMKERMMRRAREMGIADRVVFTGFMIDVSLAYQAIDIYVCPSIVEWGLSLSVQEAITYKLPVIATDAGGLPELVRDNETGYIVPAGDSSTMSERIKVFIQDPVLAKRFAEKAFLNYRLAFSLNNMIRLTRNFYLDVIK